MNKLALLLALASTAHADVACTLSPEPLRVKAKRVVAIGDLHGDLDAARAALRAAKATDGQDRWIGGDLVVVQTGDVLDRGDDESKILALFERLEVEAHKKGGAVIPLLGNHELMNAAHDFRYVTPGGAQDFDGDRERELAPGGVWAKKLARHNIVEIVGDTVFSHAGVNMHWAASVEDLDLRARCWLAGQEGNVQKPTTALTEQDSPVWTREFGGDSVDCNAVSEVLKKLGVRRMVVGHTVQKAGITSACDGALWRIDVGMSKAYGGPIQVLSIAPGSAPQIVSGTR